jgi:heme-degrading monooxygenase HmoA
MADGDSYASANWLVAEGNEGEFEARWIEFLEWTRDNAQGFRGAELIRSERDPRRFVSFSRWDDESDQRAWRWIPEFVARFGACKDLCEETQGGTFRRVASVGPPG